MECKIDDLPDEILEYILSLISPYKDLQECLYVSKRWYQATKNVTQHTKAHFQKSVASGSLFWSMPCDNICPSTIGKRHSHSACTYSNSMYVFGGCTAAGTTFNDLWKLDLNRRKWTKPVTMGSYPSPKANASMLYYNKSFILFGGWSYPSVYPVYQQWKLFNELHVFSIETNQWTAIETLDGPPPTSAHSASIHKNLMVIFGGLTEGQVISNDVWCLNLDDYTWKKQSTSHIKPLPRCGQSQIPLGDKHLLILGGGTSPEVRMNDAWLLTMEDPIWTWKKVNIKNSVAAPVFIWCSQTCKVGNNIIVLSKRKRLSQTNVSSLVKPLNQQNIPHTSQSSSSDRQKFSKEIDRDENVNGRRGFLNPRRPILRKSFSLNSSHSHHIAPMPVFESTISLAAFRDEPVRSPSSNRQRQLELLHKMEETLRNRRIQNKTVKKSENALSIFVLDISNVLSEECYASWVPLKQNEPSGPDNRVLCSLVLGKGELIVFGGRKENEWKTQACNDEVYNDLLFIHSSRFII